MTGILGRGQNNLLLNKNGTKWNQKKSQILQLENYLILIKEYCLRLLQKFVTNGTTRFKNVNNCLNSNFCSYLETAGGQSYNLYLNVVHFFKPVLIRHLWHLKTVIFLHWCIIHVVLLFRWSVACTVKILWRS